jgi:hypothetical protein
MSTDVEAVMSIVGSFLEPGPKSCMMRKLLRAQSAYKQVPARGPLINI